MELRTLLSLFAIVGLATPHLFARVDERQFGSPNREYVIHYTVDFGEVERVEHKSVATLKSNDKLIWSYVPPYLWFVRIQNGRATMIDLNLESMWDRMNDFLSAAGEPGHSAPKNGVDLDAANWKTASQCVMHYYFRGIGNGDADISVDVSESHPQLRVLGMRKASH